MDTQFYKKIGLGFSRFLQAHVCGLRNGAFIKQHRNHLGVELLDSIEKHSLLTA